MTRRRIRARVGEPFEVLLPVQPTSGHRWCVRHCARTLQLVENLRPHNLSAIGNAVGQTFIGRPQRAGSYRLRFALERPWERRPADWAIVSVRAKKALRKQDGR